MFSQSRYPYVGPDSCSRAKRNPRSNRRRVPSSGPSRQGLFHLLLAFHSPPSCTLADRLHRIPCIRALDYRTSPPSEPAPFASAAPPHSSTGTPATRHQIRLIRQPPRQVCPKHLFDRTARMRDYQHARGNQHRLQGPRDRSADEHAQASLATCVALAAMCVSSTASSRRPTSLPASMSIRSSDRATSNTGEIVPDHVGIAILITPRDTASGRPKSGKNYLISLIYCK